MRIPFSRRHVLAAALVPLAACGRHETKNSAAPTAVSDGRTSATVTAVVNQSSSGWCRWEPTGSRWAPRSR